MGAPCGRASQTAERGAWRWEVAAESDHRFAERTQVHATLRREVTCNVPFFVAENGRDRSRKQAIFHGAEPSARHRAKLAHRRITDARGLRPATRPSRRAGHLERRSGCRARA